MAENLLKIGEAAEILGVSIDTLRRWDESGKLIAIKKEGGAHRLYREKDLEIFASDHFKFATDWITGGTEFPKRFYCQTSPVFQAKLVKMEQSLMQESGFEKLFSLIVLVAGEIGDNSFSHNLGKWPDTQGIFFGYDLAKGVIVLADRGLGVLETLRQVRPNLQNHVEAVKVAFTEFISGRAPEKRGNGLKLVREVTMSNPIDLFYQSGDAEVRIQGPERRFQVTRGQSSVRGCVAKIQFR